MNEVIITLNLSSMFKKPNQKKYISISSQGSPEIPKGLWKKCNYCKAPIMTEEVIHKNYTCPKCGKYFRMTAKDRLQMILDEGSFEEWDVGLSFGNPINYRGYEEKLAVLREKTKLDEAIITGAGKIHGQEVVVGVCDGRFLMASMGKTVGEKIARAIERATEKQLPVIIFACSGGARMQEGIHSLMQMAKTAAAIKRHHDAGGLYISVLTDPTTGGVTASFAMLGDIILAEPNALIGFAGPRVIEQTIAQTLPEGFQRAEFLLQHGFIDKIVKREDMKDTIFQILQMHQQSEMTDLKVNKMNEMDHFMKEELSSWERVLRSREKQRPVGSDYIEALFSDFIEFHGDRCYHDDKAIIGGIASFRGMPVTVIAQAKGRNTKENIERNYGMPSPDGYRKALRLMKQAEKFHRPVICFVDTPGAFCGIEAEERGQGEVIARNLFEMSALKVPILSIIIGEGGSGGALAMATSDEVWMLENSIYSILSPEGFASILWKDSSLAKEAAGVMKLTAKDLKKAGIVERVFAEPREFTKETMCSVVHALEMQMIYFMEKYGSMKAEELVDKRYKRFRNM